MKSPANLTKINSIEKMNLFHKERIKRLKDRLLSAPYEICMARAKYFTDSYRETEGMDPHLRNAYALKNTLDKQKIFVREDEFLAGSKTEKFLAGALSVERGDFLRTLQLEMDILHLKRKPFFITEEDRTLFWEKILSYWDGKTVRDIKAEEWIERGIVDVKNGIFQELKNIIRLIRFLKFIGRENWKKIAGANLKAPLSLKRLRNLRKLKYELSFNNPSPAIYCFDVQGHLCLGVENVVKKGMLFYRRQAEQKLSRILNEEQGDESAKNFLRSVILSIDSAVGYANRFAILAEQMAEEAEKDEERLILEKISEHLKNVPAHKPESFWEALQSAWITHLVGEIQYGTHDVFAAGRADQFLYEFYKKDREEGKITDEFARSLLQEYFLKLSANVEPVPETGMETNAVLGNSQHNVIIGGLRRDGTSGVNELSYLILSAYEEMKGAVNQLCVRISKNTPFEFLKRAVEVLRNANGLAFYNDEAIVKALIKDGMSVEDARDYTIVGCVETSGNSNTHGCPGGHELVLPAVLNFTLTEGRYPPPAPGQLRAPKMAELNELNTFEELLSAFEKQLAHQIEILVNAAGGKDRAYIKFLPAPYVSAFMDDCIEKAKDITRGGARYDFTSIDVRGLATLVDSLLAIKYFVYDRKEISLKKYVKIMLRDYKGFEKFRQRIINEPPKYGTGDDFADDLTLHILKFMHQEAQKYKNERGGKFRLCYYSYGNHVIDGFLIGPTPDGRKRGEPISNGVSTSNLVRKDGGFLDVMKTVSKFPPEIISSGISLNIRIHPQYLKTESGITTLAKLIKGYFDMGGMHIQPNVVSAETLKNAQAHPEKHRDLIVKVSGYSAYFTDLGKSIQDDIIERAEYCG